VLHILHVAAQESNVALIDQAFKCMEQVIEKHYALFLDNFGDGVRTLLAFGQCKANTETSLRAIGLVLQATGHLADRNGSSMPPPAPPTPEQQDVMVGGATGSAMSSSSHPAAHWFSVLRGLSVLIGDPRKDVRQAALNGVFDCLRTHGCKVFDEDTWHMIFNGVIKPLFDDIHHQLANAEGRKPDSAVVGAAGSPEGKSGSWAAAIGPPTCSAALTALLKLFDAHLDTLVFLLDDVLKLIQNCILHDTEAIARIGVEGFKLLLSLTGKRIQPEPWQKITGCILRLFRDSMPRDLMCEGNPTLNNASLPFRKDEVVIQCVVQLLLIDMLQGTVTQHYRHISPDGIMTLLDALRQSFEFAQDFNRRVELRKTLKRLGFMKEMKQLPGLLKQEREALACTMKILFEVQQDTRIQDGELADEAAERLLCTTAFVLENYVKKEQLLQEQAEATGPEPAPNAGTAAVAAHRELEVAAQETEREVLGLVPIVSEVVLRGLRDLQQGQFARHAPRLFPLLCELLVVNSLEVRLMVKEVFLKQMAPAATGENCSGNRPAAFLPPDRAVKTD